MTPERADQFLSDVAQTDSWSAWQVIARKAILAACNEERRAALTEAAIVCANASAGASRQSVHIALQLMSDDIIALRDREPR